MKFHQSSFVKMVAKMVKLLTSVWTDLRELRESKYLPIPRGAYDGVK